MTATTEAERDWAAYYLLQRSAPLTAAGVHPDHFGDPRVRQWYLAARKLGDWVRFDELGITVDDSLALTPRLVTQKELPEIERRIVEGWAKRKVRAACADFMRRTGSDKDTCFDDATKALLQEVTEAQSGMPCDSITHAVAGAQAIEGWLEAAQAPEPRAIPLPWPKLHRHTHGVPRKKLIFIGGRSSEHKTTFARSIAAHAADKCFRVLYWTLEDNTGDIAGRTIVDATGWPTTTALATGGWPTDRRPDRTRLETGFEAIGRHLKGNIGKSLRYLDRSNPTRHQVISTIRAEAARGLDVFVGDFIQLVRPDDPRTLAGPDWWRTTCAMFSALAQDLDIPIVWVSQIEKTGTKESKEASRLPFAVEMPHGAQLFQGAYGVIMVGFEGDKFKARIEKWKSAAAKGKPLFLHVDPAHDRITEV